MRLFDEASKSEFDSETSNHVKPEGRLSNNILYRQVAAAFTYVKSISSGSLEGDVSEFMSILRQKTSSVFGEREDRQTADVKSLLMDMNRSGRLWQGEVDDIVFDPNESNSESRKRVEEEDHTKQLFNTRSRSLGIDAYATYLPIHFFFEDDWFGTCWGIYISEEGVQHLSMVLQDGFVRRFGSPPSGESSLFRQIALEVLLRHELEHFKIESFALNAEVHLGRPLYVPYALNIYAKTFPSVECLEEGLSNATVLNSQVIRQHVSKLYPEQKHAWRQIIQDHLFSSQPDCYRNYGLEKGWPKEPRFEKKSRMGLRREAMNYLCNQVISGDVRPKSLIPFHAFLPDNYFLRADRLVPIYLVKSLDPRSSFIEFRRPGSAGQRG